MQVKLALTHHVMSSSNDALQLTAEKSLTFVLDALKSRDAKKEKSKKRKKTASGHNSKSFGSVLDISKFKNASRFTVGWRARLQGNQTSLHECCFLAMKVL